MARSCRWAAGCWRSPRSARFAPAAGAILPDSAKVSFHVLEPLKRPVAVVADQKELRDIREVHVEVCRKHQLTLLFDRGSGLEERIFSEQFLA